MLIYLANTFPRLATLWTFGTLDDTLIRDSFARAQNRPCSGKAFAFHFTAEEKGKIINLIPVSLRRHAVREAEDIMSYRFRFSGVSHNFSDGIDWFIEPCGNKGWRWGLNRHAWLLTLARAYLYSKKPQYAKRIEQLLLDWCDRHPYDVRNPNWNEPFEVAARLNNWIWLYFLLKDTEHISQEVLTLLLEGIYKQACHLYRYIEDHVPSNHLLLEAKALYEASLVLQDVPAAKKWGRNSLRYLERQFRGQVKADGGHSEQATTYHRIITSELLEIYALAQTNGNSRVVALLQDGLIAMCEFCDSFMRADGSLPVIGDSTSIDTYYRFNPFMIGAAVFDRPGYRSAAIILGEDDLTFFVLGLEGTEKYGSLASGPAVKLSACFPDSGYYVMRDECLGLHAVIDCGAFCDKTITGHGHDDILGFDLSLHDSPLIVDSGNDGLPRDAPEGTLWRAYFRGAKAHNVVVVDGRNRSDLIGYAEVLRIAKPLECEWHTDNALTYFAGAHDGYLRSLGVIHQREMILVKGRFLCVIDKLLGAGNHEVELLYHLAPDMRAILNEQGTVEILRGTEPWAKLNIFGLSGSAGTFRGCRSPVQGWVSFESGVRIEADTVCFHADGTLPLWIGTLIHSYKMGSCHVEDACCNANRPDEVRARFIVSESGASYEFCSSAKAGYHASGHSGLHGRFVLARLHEGGTREILYAKR
jgi:uncharacterized heparinase superfamily protein